MRACAWRRVLTTKFPINPLLNLLFFNSPMNCQRGNQNNTFSLFISVFKKSPSPKKEIPKELLKNLFVFCVMVFAVD